MSEFVDYKIVVSDDFPPFAEFWSDILDLDGRPRSARLNVESLTERIANLRRDGRDCQLEERALELLRQVRGVDLAIKEGRRLETTWREREGTP